MRDVTDHSRMEVLSSAECFQLLGTVPIGRIAYVADGAPQIFPVTFTMHEDRIVFRSGIGSKLDAAEMGRQVAFEADGWDEEHHTGWSVVVRGRARPVVEPAPLEDLAFQPWLAHSEMEWIQITPEELSGRRLPA